MEPLLETFLFESKFAILMQFFIMVVVSIIPFAPIPILATMIGANHSFWIGLLINLGGTIIGSVILFWLSTNLLRNLANKMFLKYSIYKRFIKLIQINGFLAVFLGRIVPILPSAGISLIAGVSGVTFFAFTTATILGKLPTILAFSLAGNQMALGNWKMVLLIALYLFVIILIRSRMKKYWHF